MVLSEIDFSRTLDSRRPIAHIINTAVQSNASETKVVLTEIGSRLSFKDITAIQNNAPEIMNSQVDEECVNPANDGEKNDTLIPGPLVLKCIQMADKINIIKWDKSTDGTLTDENMRKKLRSMGYQSTMYIFPPGTEFPDHTHNMTKFDAITSGKFHLSMLKHDVIKEPGDIVEVPKNVVHNAHVVGTEDVTFFDSIKS